jgi:hypothetical protein
MKTMLIVKIIQQLLVLTAFFVIRITLFFLSLFPIKFEINFFEHPGFFNRTDLQCFFKSLALTSKLVLHKSTKKSVFSRVQGIYPSCLAAKPDLNSLFRVQKSLCQNGITLL